MQSTQRTITAKSYLKLLEYCHSFESVLDFGSGKGLGSAILNSVVPTESFEPFPSLNEPTYRRYEDIKKVYDGVICLNVLNVLNRHDRDQAVLRIGSKARVFCIIGVRSWSKSISGIRGCRGDEPRSVITSAGSYQKGFTGPELVGYLSELLPDFTTQTFKICDLGVLLTRCRG